MLLSVLSRVQPAPVLQGAGLFFGGVHGRTVRLNTKRGMRRAGDGFHTAQPVGRYDQ